MKAWAKAIRPNFSGPIVLKRYGRMTIGRMYVMAWSVEIGFIWYYTHEIL